MNSQDEQSISIKEKGFVSHELDSAFKNPRDYQQFENLVRSKSARLKKHSHDSHQNNLLFLQIPDSKHFKSNQPIVFNAFFGTSKDSAKIQKKIKKTLSQGKCSPSPKPKLTHKESFQDTLNSVFHSVIIKRAPESPRKPSKDFFVSGNQESKRQKAKAFAKTFLNSSGGRLNSFQPPILMTGAVPSQKRSSSFFLVGKLVTPSSRSKPLRSKIDSRSLVIPSESMTLDSPSKPVNTSKTNQTRKSTGFVLRNSHSRPNSGSSSGVGSGSCPLEKSDYVFLKIKKNPPILCEDYQNQKSGKNSTSQETKNYLETFSGHLSEQKDQRLGSREKEKNVSQFMDSVLMTQCIVNERPQTAGSLKNREKIIFKRKATVVSPSTHNIFRFK